MATIYKRQFQCILSKERRQTDKHKGLRAAAAAASMVLSQVVCVCAAVDSGRLAFAPEMQQSNHALPFRTERNLFF